MNRRLVAALIAGLSLLLITPSTFAQSTPSPTTVGISAGLKDSPNTFTVPGTVSLPIWLTDQFVLAPELGFISRENGQDALSVGADGRFFFRQGRVAPYAGPGLRILNIEPPGPADGDSALVLSGFGGAEYFLANGFSFSVEGRLEILTGDNTVVTTAGVVRATVYF